jgi:DNA-nicking Smr family endonuclease
MSLDRPLRRALARGQTQIEARIDLHGMTQADAHGALFGFLRRTQAQGVAVVLVITGKGGPGATDGRFGDGQRGILRRLVPLWLSLPEMRRVVSGFSEAGPRHGGGGALYVRLRRPSRL